MAAEFPDGQLYIDLRGAEGGARLNPSDVLRQFLKALGIPSEEIPPSAGERAGMFRSLLRNRRFLILLDNADDEAQVRLLLPSSPGCLVLITSRRPLAALDTARPPLQLGTLDEQEATEMLSRLAGSDRVLAQPEHAAEVIRLCGGLPLALRIVAGRLRTRPQWPVSEIVRRLADERRRLVELKVGDLDVRASFMLSYRELDDAQALLFRRLGILPEPTFDLLLATAVGGQTVVGGSATAISTMHSFDHALRHEATVSRGAQAIEDEERAAMEKVEAELEGLVDAQLIEIAALSHYRMHDLVRLFASELLRDDDAHLADHLMVSWNYVFWAQSQADAAIAWTSLLSDDLPARYQQNFRGSEEVNDWLERNRLNLLAAVSMAYENNQDYAVIDLFKALWYLFPRHGFWADLEAVLGTARAAAQRSGDLSSEAEVLFALGTLRLRERSFPEAAAALKESLALIPSSETKESRAQTLTYLANALTCTGQLVDADACLAEAEHLTQAPTGAIPRIAASIAGERATLLDLRGDTAGAISIFERAVEISQDANDSLQQASFLERIGCIYLRQHLRAPAIRYFKESLALCRDDDIQHLRIRSEATLSLARAHMIDGVSSEATKLLSQALDNFQRLQIPEKEAEVLYYQVLAYKKLQKLDSAQDCWTKAIEALNRTNPETTKHLRDLIVKSRPQQATSRRPRTRPSRKARANRRRQG
jgi:tetratricopeptide (TPR) repeat protein